MKKLIYISIISSLVVLLSSCDVLNEKLVSEVSTDSHYTTPGGFEDAVNAAYTPLRNYYGNNVGAYLEEYGTDLIQNAGHGGFHHYNQFTAALNSEDDIINSHWSSSYEAINTTNAAINRAEQLTDLTESEQQTVQTRLGEAHALRAFYYFLLVQHFGAVHLTTEETIGVEIEANRTPPAEVYTQIVSDLETAISNLPSDPAEQQWGRVTEPAAKMMLSQVLLTRGYQDFAESDDFSRAATLAESVINDYNFQLLEDYGQIFAQDNQQNSEIVWSVQYGTNPLLNSYDDGDQAGNHSHVYYRPWYEVYSDGLVRSMEYGRPWIRFKMTPFALENFRPLDQDSRYDKSFQDTWRYNDAASLPTDQYPNVSVGDTAIYIDPHMSAQEVQQKQDQTPYYLMSWATAHTAENINMFPNLKKHNDFERPSVNEYAGTKDYFVYRLAEAYLFAAEAHLMDGNPGAAVPHINAVRRRAAWPGEEANMEISEGDVTLDFILDERGREFYGESKRWTTLKRTGKFIERSTQYPGELAGSPSREAANVMKSAPEKYGNKGYQYLLRPIPATQITRTEGGYEQNPGY